MRAEFLLEVSLFCLCVYAAKPVTRDSDVKDITPSVIISQQASACEKEELRLNCTDSTVISVMFVWYGRRHNSGHLCPGPGSFSSKPCSSDKALEVVEKRCQGAQRCRMVPSVLDDDPCPGVRKYAEVVYKCRPRSYITKITCDDKRMKLSCNKTLGIVVLSARYGLTKADVPECPNSGSRRSEDCSVDYTDFVKYECSRKEICRIRVDKDTFESPDCSKNGVKHLKVVFACVEKELILQNSMLANENSIQETSYPAWAHASGHSTEPTFEHKYEMQRSDEVLAEEEAENKGPKLVGFVARLMSAVKYMTDNRSKLIIYIAISVGVGAIVFVTTLIASFIIRNFHSSADQRKKDNKTATTTDAEDQFFSDSDLENFDPFPTVPPTIAAINFSTSTRKSSETLPKALVANGADRDNYFS